MKPNTLRVEVELDVPMETLAKMRPEIARAILEGVARCLAASEKRS